MKYREAVTVAPRGGIPDSSHWRGLLIVAVVLTVPFWVTDLDLTVSGWFFDPLGAEPWPLDKALFWQFWFYGVPVMTALVGVGALAVLLLAAIRPRHGAWARPAVFVLATTIVGPGLLVNEVFKQHWGRPRPRQLEQFAGDLPYQPVLAPNFGVSGKSFPCGHSSIGFVVMSAGLLVPVARRRKRWALFAGGAALGALIGWGRVVAGAHFLSDVIWSALLTYAAALLVVSLMNTRVGESVIAVRQWVTRSPRVAAMAGGASLALVVGGAALATPFQVTQTEPIALGAGTPLSLHLDAPDSHVRFIRVADRTTIGLRLSSRGFGLPASGEKLLVDSRSAAETRIRVEKSGVLTELNSRLNILVPPGLDAPVNVYVRAADVDGNGVEVLPVTVHRLPLSF